MADYYALHFPIQMDPGLGQLHAERSYNHYVDQLVRQVLLTSKGERINRPEFGAGLRAHIFAHTGPTTGTLLKATVVEALETWLGAVLTVEHVEVEHADTTVVVKVGYRVKADGRRQGTVLEVTGS
jgi:hypothetical protein